MQKMIYRARNLDLGLDSLLYFSCILSDAVKRLCLVSVHEARDFKGAQVPFIASAVWVALTLCCLENLARIFLK